MSSGIFDDPRVTSALPPGVLAFLKANQPPDDKDANFEAGHWMALLAGALTQLETSATELTQAQQRIRELEADA
jgi:hypothetical protein